MADENVPGRNFAVASMILGIVSLVFMFTGGAAFVAIASGVIGLILGIKANKMQKQSMATAGIVMCAIGLGIGALVFIACILCIVAAGAAVSQIDLESGIQGIQNVIDGLE